MEETIVLPNNIDAEEYILGGILMDNSALDTVTEILNAQDFYAEKNRIFFEEILELRDKGKPINFVSLTEAVIARNKLERVGGSSEIARLAERAVTTADIDYYANLVKNKSILRSLISGANDIIKIARTNYGEVSEALEQSEDIIFRINRDIKMKSGGLSDVKDLLHTLYDKLHRMSKGEITEGTIPTGFIDLDNIFMGGLHQTDLVIIAARPAMGKTSLAMNIAEYVALQEEKTVVFFSIEMGQEQLILRLLSSISGINQGSLRNPKFLRQDEWSQLLEATNVLDQAKIMIDTQTTTPTEMRSRLRRLALQLQRENRTIDLIVVDYLQLMKAKYRIDSREQEIAEISRNMKGIAKEFNVPVIMLSQLNRQVEGRADKRPMLSELRESGSIEQDADIVCFIYRDDYYNPDTEDKGVAEIIVSKHRNGPTGTVKLSWQPELTKFRSYEAGH